jgi:hypothetical protein
MLDSPVRKAACMSQSIVLWDFATSSWHEKQLIISPCKHTDPDHPTFGCHLDVKYAVLTDAS